VGLCMVYLKRLTTPVVLVGAATLGYSKTDTC